ncbi:MAG TPA: hypothetical protein VFZ75_05535 [Actinomycetota bacterium]|nr:hypothetical protein [Actinomycetota bacterium]
MNNRLKALFFAVVMVGFPHRRKLMAGIALCLAFMAIGVLPAFAHHPTLSSVVVCNEQTGDYDVTWTIANGDFQGRTMTLDQSSRTAVPLSSYAPNESKSYSESLPGDTSGVTTLTIRADWDNGGSQDVVASTTVNTGGTCSTEHVPEIDVEKSCPAEIPAGKAIEYTITVENTGTEPLVGVSVIDSLLGDITADFDFDFTDPFPVGEVATATVFYTPLPGDPDPLTNAVTATGTGEDSGAEATDEASCETDITHEPGIDVTKTCPAEVAAGEAIQYTIAVRNTGTEPLVGVTVNDTLLGNITANLPNPLPVGGTVYTATPLYTPQAGDPDPLTNMVTASGLGEDTEAQATDTAACQTDVLNPDIDIVKTVDEETVPVGTTVTYTYVITNTGDATLFDVTVDDDILGHIGDIPVLEPGQSVTMTKDFEVGEEPVINVAVAEGDDVLGRSVSADDDAIVTPILGETQPPPPTPFTGSDAGRLGVIAMGLFGLGATLVATTRRRRERETA